MRTVVVVVLALAVPSTVSANWFNKSEQYLAACRDEAFRRYYKDISSEDARRQIYLCMIGHGYAYRQSCHEDGWVTPDCYRLKYKTEGP